MLSNGRKPRVLMAVNPRAAGRMGRILDGLRVERAESLRDLVHKLRCSSFDLVIVGSHFDGSRSIEALNRARLLAAHAALACVRVIPFSSSLGEGTLSALYVAADELGVDLFIDVLQIPDDENGNAGVRAMLERLVYVT